MGKSAPEPTPPKETSAATTGTNVSTSIANNMMGNINEIGPDGSTRVDQTGSYAWTDPYTGQKYEVPTFTRTTELSDAQKAIKGQSDAASLNLATLGNNLSGQLGDKLTGNFTIGNEATEQRLYDLGSKRLDPQFAQQEEALRTRLMNSGVREGSAAWNSEMNRFQQGKNDAYNQLLLTGRGQATQEQLTEDNQRINQISALLSGGQVSQPNFMGANITPIQGTDNASIIANYDQSKLNAWKAGQPNLGGLFSGIGQGIGSWIASDERIKKDIKKRGEIDGMGLYEYRYKGASEGSPKHLGLMAQEVVKKKPGAVARMPSGIMAVNYDKAIGLMGMR